MAPKAMSNLLVQFCLFFFINLLTDQIINQLHKKKRENQRKKKNSSQTGHAYLSKRTQVFEKTSACEVSIPGVITSSKRTRAN